MGIRQILLPAVFLVSALLSSSTAANNSTAPGVTFPLPSSCPASCGSITFEYPFGAGHGCFRPGFELTCITATNRTKLLLGNSSSGVEVVSNISTYPIFDVTTPVAVMDVNDSFAYTSWTAPAKAPYFISSQDIKFWVVGCSAEGTLVDLTTNQTLASCKTDEGQGEDYNADFDSNSCDCLDFVDSGLVIQSYGIRLSRANHTRAVNSSVVEGMIFSTASIESRRADSSMHWHISDHGSCKEAEKDKSSYACLGENTECDDDNDTGYSCLCRSVFGYDTNPYLPDGCDDASLVVVPPSNCSTVCGNVSVPFPFGLEKGCYRQDSFALTCNDTFDPPVLSFKSFTGRVVYSITVEEGLQIELSPVDEFKTTSWTGYTTSGSFAFSQDQVIYNWTVESQSCAEAKLKMTTFACRSRNSTCVDTDVTSVNRTGYYCKCLKGFGGNPYIPDGCADIDECKNPQVYPCFGVCVNTIGSYSCTCPTGTHVDPIRGICISDKKGGLLLGIIIGVCVGFVTLFLAITSVFATGKWKKISEMRIRKRHFHRNHGLLFQQLIASDEDNTEKIKIFSLQELEKATNNFDTSRILGQGGHGIVYKGILSDQRIVAIKRSKITMTREIDEFINEVIVLSKINHRNIVKLFGCCLEIEVPLLVYEFISNGTLFYHLHNPDCKSSLSWSDRLRIATEAAGALAYLHSSASISIFHRDMKSSNILLDEYYTSKVSDFGTSRFIRVDQTHKFTAIQGTFGYLDPEYYQTSKLTGKSDVYGFGVILLELLTGQKPVTSVQVDEEGNLVTRFIRALRENQQFELMEHRVMEEGTREELIEVANLAEMCLKLKGSERPTMREVEVQLRFLRRAKEIHE